MPTTLHLGNELVRCARRRHDVFRGGDLSKKCVPTRRKQREREQGYSLKLDHSPSIFFICSMTSRGCATTDLAMASSSSPVFGSVSNFLFLTSARKAGSLMVF